MKDRYDQEPIEYMRTTQNPYAPQEKLYRIHMDRVQKIVNEFCLNDRHWSAYPATNIEVILKFYAMIPPRAYYKNFDPSTLELIFREVVQSNLDTGKAKTLVIDLEIKEIIDNERPQLGAGTQEPESNTPS